MLSLHLNSKCSFSKQNSRTIQSNKSHAFQVFQALSRTTLTFVRASLYSVFSRNAWSHWRMATKRFENSKRIFLEKNVEIIPCVHCCLNWLRSISTSLYIFLYRLISSCNEKVYWSKRSKLQTYFDNLTVFENHRKSLIQHSERSELRLHFEWTKVN